MTQRHRLFASSPPVRLFGGRPCAFRRVRHRLPHLPRGHCARTRLASHAFGIIQVMVVIGIIALAIAMFLPSMCRSRESANRVKCSSNLRQIGQAILLYTNDHKGRMPRQAFVEGAIPTWGTAAPAPNDVSAAMFLLLRTQDITPEVFTCPSSNAEKWDFGGGANTAANWSNWTDVNRNLSYSYQNPYWTPPPMLSLSGAGTRELAIAADINPGVGGKYSDVTGVTTTSTARDMKRANSKNHDEDGQNVLYGDGHVDFESNPFVGVNRDNIFTARSGTYLAAPADPDDSVLLPVGQ